MNQKGSLTVMASLSLMIIASVLCVLLEAARQQGLKTSVIMAEQSAMESALSGYERTLFDEYNLMLYDLSFGGESFDLGRIEGELLIDSQKNMTSDYYCATVLGQQLTEYYLTTDDKGAAFRKAVIDAEKPYLAEDVYNAAKNLLGKGKGLYETGANAQNAMDAADGSIESARAERESLRELAKENDTTGPPEPNVHNPIDDVKKLKKKGILSLVLPEGKAASQKSVSKSELLSNRNVLSGNWTGETFTESSASDILCNAFLDSRLSCYGRENTGKVHALDYEREYIVGGKTSDVDNLKTVVNEIMLIRTGINFAKIHAKPEKVSEALSIATSLLAFTVVGEAAAPAVAEGIIGAWAYMDSVEDLKALMRGRKVDSFSYEDYLNILVFLKSKETQNLKTMDIIEQNLRLLTENPLVKLDNMAVSVEAEGTYEISPLFFKRVGIYELSCRRRISYLKA